VIEEPVRRTETEAVLDAIHSHRLVELFAPCFTEVLQLQANEAFGEPEGLRPRLKSLLRRSERAALEAGHESDAVEEAKFAVVAFVDETILSSNWAGTEEWMKTPLQLEFYDQFDAGEVFFDRLDDLLDAPAQHAEALEVYYHCMSLGFRGKYQLQEQERFREIVERTAEALTDAPVTSTDALAPHGPPRDQTAAEVENTLPNWVIAAAAALLGVLLYGGMYLYVTFSAHEVAQTIGRLGAG
jgi:type VI secretion system protein ImpK